MYLAALATLIQETSRADHYKQLCDELCKEIEHEAKGCASVVAETDGDATPDSRRDGN